MHFQRFLFIFLVFVWPFGAKARLATAADLAAVNEAERAEIEIDPHGHSKLTVERTVRINSDDGREREGLQYIEFNDRTSRLKILAARTINGRDEIAVDPQNIEIKSAGDSTNAFDSQKKAKITFPKVEVGSKLLLKYEIATDEIPHEGFYSFLADFNGWYLEHYDLKIRSQLPLHYWLNDPQKILELKHSQDGKGLDVLEAHATRPVRLMTTQEKEPYIRPSRSLALVVSTLERWNQYARATIDKQEKLLSEELPPLAKRIFNEAASEKNIDAKLARVASGLARELRYFGDWRRRGGEFVPRPLKEIDETRYGDCKDLSLVATAIFRRLGFKADIAWLERGEGPSAPASDWYRLPVDAFDHAVARVESAEGKVYWIDATEPVVLVGQPPREIAGRPAFILNRDKPRLELIPELRSDSFAVERDTRYRLADSDHLSAEGSISLKGRAAVELTEESIERPGESLSYELIQGLADGASVVESAPVTGLPQSRRVSDLKIGLKYRLAGAGLRTSAGLGFRLPRESVIDRLLIDTRDRVSDLYVDQPGVWQRREELNDVRRLGSQNLDCDLKSEWARASRKVRTLKNGVVVEDRVEIVKSTIPNEDLLSPRFADFQKRLRECFSHVAVIVKRGSKN